MNKTMYLQLKNMDQFQNHICYGSFYGKKVP